jgi:hypothetical protein
MLDVMTLQRLIDEYGSLRRLQGHTAQSRGRRFNHVIAELLRCWAIDARVSLRSAGEIDVAFACNGVRYVLEAKWEKARTDTGHIAKLQKRVRQRLAGTYGIFLSMSGYSDEALADVAHGERLEVVLLDAGHFEAMLSGMVAPQELLSLVQDQASFLGEAYAPLLTLLASADASPMVEFPLPSLADNPLVQSSTPEISAEMAFSVPDSRQLGIACAGPDRLLATTQHGIIEVDLKTHHVGWAVPVRDCHRNPLVDDRGAILFTRRYGVGRVHRGELTVVGGGFPGATCLLRHPDGSSWVLSNGDLDNKTATSVTMLGARLGDEERHDLDYPPASASGAVWLTDTDVLTIGNPFFTLTTLTTGQTRRYRAAQSNPMGVVKLDDSSVLTAGDAVTLGRTDLRTGEYREIAQLALRPSVNELALSPDGCIYIASYDRSPTAQMSFVVARVQWPRQRPGDGLPVAAARIDGTPATESRPVTTTPPTSARRPAAAPAAQRPVARRTPTQPPVAPAVPWNVVRTDRGNQQDAYVTFEVHRGLYWIVVGLSLALILVLSILATASDLSGIGKLVAGLVAIVVLILTVSFANMARSPVRLEIGAQGVQVFARSETTWIPWEVIERIDIVPVQGHQYIVAWCRGADMFPEFDTFGGGPHFLPKLGAIAICPVSVLRTRRHVVARALRTYGGNRVGSP